MQQRRCVLREIRGFALPWRILPLVLVASLLYLYGLAATSANTDSHPPPSGSSPSASPSISAATLLLPPRLATVERVHSVSHPLTVSHGCYEWSADQSLLTLSVDPAYRCVIDGRQGARGVNVSSAIDWWDLNDEKEQDDDDDEEAVGPAFTGIEPRARIDGRGRKSSFISAHPLVPSHPSLDCEVFIDLPVRLALLTSTHRVYVHQNDSLQLLAFDRFDNSFSSLRGLPFSWSTADPNVLSILQLEEAGVTFDPILFQMEMRGDQGDQIAVRGNSKGRTIITASLAYLSSLFSTTSAIPSVPTPFIVIEPLCIFPSFTRLLPAAAFFLQLLSKDTRTDPIAASSGISHNLLSCNQDKQGLIQSGWFPLPLPSTTYNLTTHPLSVLQFDVNSGRVLTKMAGTGRVVAVDRNIAEHKTHMSVIVVSTARIQVKLVESTSSHSNDTPGWWKRDGRKRNQLDQLIVTEGNRLEIVVTLVTDDRQEELIDLAPNTLFTARKEGDSILIQDHEKQSAFSIFPPSLTEPSPFASLRVVATTSGLTTFIISIDSITDSLTSFKYHLPSPQSISLPILVTPPLTFSSVSSPLRLPYLGKSGKEIFSLLVQGGSGYYEWTTSEEEVLRVVISKNSATAKLISGTKQGTILITVSDIFSLSKANLEVIVSAPSRLIIAEGLRETLIGERIELTISVSPAYTDCSALPLTVSIVEGSAYRLLPSASSSGKYECQPQCTDIDGNCWRIAVEAISVGFCTFEASILESSTSVRTKLSSFSSLSIRPTNNLTLGAGSTGWFESKDGPLPYETDVDLIRNVRVWQLVAPLSEWQKRLSNLPLAYSAAEAKNIDRQLYGNDLVLPIASNVINIRSSHANPSRWFVECETSDSHLLIASLRVGNPVLASRLPAPIRTHAHVYIQCYPPLVPFPSSLTLAIGEKREIILLSSELTSKETGDISTSPLHPLHSFATFTSLDESVASISANGEVEAHNLGVTSILIQVTGRESFTLEETDTLTTRVRIQVKLDAFRLVSSRKEGLLVGESVILHVEGSKGGEKPISRVFSRVNCIWSSESDGVLLLPPLSPIPRSFSEAGLLAPSIKWGVHGFSVKVVGMKPGLHAIHSNISVASNDSSTSPTMTTETIFVRVWSSIDLLTPCKLILPFSSQSRIKTSHDDETELKVEYQVQTDCAQANRERLVNINKDGRVQIRPRKADEPGGDETIIVFSQGIIKPPHHPPTAPARSPSPANASPLVSPQFINFSTSVFVQVRPIASLSFLSAPLNISLSSSSSSSSFSPLLPVGTTLTTEIVLVDSLGRMFDYEEWAEWPGETNQKKHKLGPELSVEASSPELVTVQISKSSRDSRSFRSVSITALAPTAKTSHIWTGSHSADATKSSPSLTSIVLAFQMEGNVSPVLPLYLQLFITPKPLSPPFPVIVSLTIPFESMPPMRSQARTDVCHAIEKEVSQILDVPQQMVRVLRIAPFSSSVEILLLPHPASFFSSPLHPDQYFLSSLSASSTLSIFNTPTVLAQSLILLLSQREKQGNSANQASEQQQQQSYLNQVSGIGEIRAVDNESISSPVTDYCVWLDEEEEKAALAMVQRMEEWEKSHRRNKTRDKLIKSSLSSPVSRGQGPAPAAAASPAVEPSYDEIIRRIAEESRKKAAYTSYPPFSFLFSQITFSIPLFLFTLFSLFLSSLYFHYYLHQMSSGRPMGGVGPFLEWLYGLLIAAVTSPPAPLISPQQIIEEERKRRENAQALSDSNARVGSTATGTVDGNGIGAAGRRSLGRLSGRLSGNPSTSLPF